MAQFVIPEWAMGPDAPDAAAPPPPDPLVAREDKIANDARVEQAVNRFLEAKQGALFDAPDAFYRQQGEDAIHAAPVVTNNLEQVRAGLLDGLANDYQRNRLNGALDAQMQLTRERMSRHVAEQSLAWQRGIAQDRIALLAKEAAHHHNDNELIDALGHAAAHAARAHSRVGAGPPGGETEDAAAAQARSSVLGAAIQARLDRGDTDGANALFRQIGDQLHQEHAAPLQGQLDTVQRLGSAKAYADGVTSMEPAASPEEIDAQHQAALQQSETDHIDDPRQQAFVRHFLNQLFNTRRDEFRKGDDGSAKTVDTWLNTPVAEGEPQRSLPSPAVLNGLPDDSLRDLVHRLNSSAERIGMVPKPNRPSIAEDAVFKSLPAVSRDESTARDIVPVDYSPNDALVAPQGDVELAQAPPAGSTKKTSTNPVRRPSGPTPPPTPPITEEERNRRSIAAHQELNKLASAPRNAKYDTKEPLPADWEHQLPKATLNALYSAANRFGVPRRLLAAVLWQESEFKEDASKGSAAQGQGIAGVSNAAKNELIRRANLRKDYARSKELSSLNRMHGPDSVNMAAEYLRMIYDENHQSWPAAVAGYKQSPPEVYGWLRGTGQKIKEDPDKWGQLAAYLRQIFRGDPGVFDTKNLPDIP